VPDWADIKDLREVDYRGEPDYDQVPQAISEPEYATAPQMNQPLHDPRSLRVELPGLPRFMKLPVPLQRLARKRAYMQAIQYAFAARADRRHQSLTQIHGGKSTAELLLTVCVKPPGGLPSRWKDSMRQSMLTGFIRPSTQIKLDYAVTVIARALCSRPLRLVRRRANIAKISAEVAYAEREGVIIELRRDRQFYNIHMR